jgi:dTDP-4-dehydrorhamnose 3,5-epimerase
MEGVGVHRLKRIIDDRGGVMHMLRADSPLFTAFGEIYFSIVNPGAVKAWKRHLKMTQNIAVPVGMVRFALYDNRPGSASFGRVEVIETGQDDYFLVRIPPLVWYGFKGISASPALIANCADMPHDPLEIERLPHDTPEIRYEWT